MGKITFRKTIIVLFRSKLTATLPVIGSVIFTVGSVFFWPTLRIVDGTKAGSVSVGASLFVAGSALFTIAPLLDYADMSFALRDALVRKPSERGIGAYERLYKAQIVRAQRANALLYACAGACFFAGSFLFYPEERMVTTHGAWLYLVGCVLSFLAAYLAASTACELKRVAEESEQEQADPRPWARASTAAEHEEDRKELERSGCRASSTISMPPKLSSASEAPSAKGSEGGQLGSGVGADGDSMRSWLLRRWSDEDAQVVSCGLYMLGDVIYAFGSIFYFPRVAVSVKTGTIIEGAPIAERAAVVLFIVGSVCFTVGATVDLVVLLRARPPACLGGRGGDPLAGLYEADDEVPTEATNLVKP